MVPIHIFVFFTSPYFSDCSDLGESQKSPSASSLQSSNSFISSESFVSLVHKVFGGKLQTTYQCSNCKSISLHKEGFTDLHLAFPDTQIIQKTAEPLTMQKLLENYLKPEILQVFLKILRTHHTLNFSDKKILHLHFCLV